MTSKAPVSLITASLCFIALLSLFRDAIAAVDRSRYACQIFDQNGKFKKQCGRAYCSSSCNCSTTGPDEFRITCDDTNKETGEVVNMTGGFILHKNSNTLEWEDSCNCAPFKKPDMFRAPRPRTDSYCCTQCQSYGCWVNNGRLDAKTPCDPRGTKTGKRTWVKCEKSGCDGNGCGKCTCEDASDLENIIGIEYDISQTSLFYAGGPSDGGCAQCGDADVGKRNCIAKGKFCTKSSQCCNQSIPPGAGECSLFRCQ